MRDPRAPGRLCDRGREWISLRLDGELSEFEQVLLDAHLASCEGCRAFAAEAGRVTAELRDAPLEQLSRPIVLPRRRSVSFGGLRLSAAAAVAVAAVGAAGVFGLNGSHPGLVISDAERAAALAGSNNYTSSNQSPRAGREPRPKIDRIIGRRIPHRAA